jgi:predicted dinucleotide-binding enzyme
MRIGFWAQVGSAPTSESDWRAPDTRVVFSGSRSAQKLEELARNLPRASAALSPEAVAMTDAIVFAVPWAQIDDVLLQAGPLGDRS